MSLKDAAEDVAPPVKPGPKCSFGRIFRSLSDEDRAVLERMRAEGKTFVHIAKVFKRDGYDVSVFSIRWHLNGQCQCR